MAFNFNVIYKNNLCILNSLVAYMQLLSALDYILTHMLITVIHYVLCPKYKKIYKEITVQSFTNTPSETRTNVCKIVSKNHKNANESFTKREMCVLFRTKFDDLKITTPNILHL